MARTFVSANSNKLAVASAPVPSLSGPCTMACWWRPVSATVLSTLMDMHNGSNDCFRLEQTAAGKVQALAHDAGGTNQAVSVTTSTVAGTWAHMCGIWASGTDRRAFLNGTNKGTDSTNRGGNPYNATGIGSTAGGGGAFANGDIAECAMWNIALSDAEVAALSNGVAAYFVRPDALVFYAPLLQGYSPDIDIVGGRLLTLSGTPALIDGPPIRYRSGLGAMCA